MDGSSYGKSIGNGIKLLLIGVFVLGIVVASAVALVMYHL